MLVEEAWFRHAVVRYRSNSSKLQAVLMLTHFGPDEAFAETTRSISDRAHCPPWHHRWVAPVLWSSPSSPSPAAASSNLGCIGTQRGHFPWLRHVIADLLDSAQTPVAREYLWASDSDSYPQKCQERPLSPALEHSGCLGWPAPQELCSDRCARCLARAIVQPFELEELVMGCKLN